MSVNDVPRAFCMWESMRRIFNHRNYKEIDYCSLARIVAPGMAHHVTQRGNRRMDVFLNAQDYRFYLHVLGRNALKYDMDIWAYCLMTNHVHLIVVPQTLESLADALRDTHTSYAQFFNKRYDFSGHLWQARFYSCVLDEQHAWSAVRYVERNPVRASITTRAEDHPWSSASSHCSRDYNPLLSKDFPGQYGPGIGRNGCRRRSLPPWTLSGIKPISDVRADPISSCAGSKKCSAEESVQRSAVAP